MRALIARFRSQTIPKASFILPVCIFPCICYFDEFLITVLSDEFCRLPVFGIFVSFFAIELIDGLAFLNFRAISTGIIVPADAADLDPAFSLAEITLFIIVSELTSLAYLLF